MEGCRAGAENIVTEGSIPMSTPNSYAEVDTDVDVDAETEVDDEEGVGNDEEIS